jgi:hypothetical protein
LILNYFFYGLSHFQLPLAGTETRHDLRESAGFGEDGCEIRHARSLAGDSLTDHPSTAFIHAPLVVNKASAVHAQNQP